MKVHGDGELIIQKPTEVDGPGTERISMASQGLGRADKMGRNRMSDGDHSVENNKK
jgi:hypothetical protein